eukprot:TRINITY_DN10033_c0_g1_i3.p1 TRINITY_DN10033_c0_g1~~TRINITY_DN10033_c0_g1_i3.p1  ORF type:complete len:189 (+),score=35.44 TRINITY_DN10033_c0_g1_i3:57-623(+)
MTTEDTLVHLENEFCQFTVANPPPFQARKHMKTYQLVFQTASDMSRNSGGILYELCKRLFQTYFSEMLEGLDSADDVRAAWARSRPARDWGTFTFRYLNQYYTRLAELDSVGEMIRNCFMDAAQSKVGVDPSALQLEQGMYWSVQLHPFLPASSCALMRVFLLVGQRVGLVADAVLRVLPFVNSFCVK